MAQKILLSNLNVTKIQVIRHVLTLKNIPQSFQSTGVLETGQFDFHMMTLFVMRKCFKKFQRRIIV